MRKINQLQNSNCSKRMTQYLVNLYFLIKNVDFKVIWESEELSESNKETIGNIYKHYLF